jgi:hypothetical protein
MLENQTSVAFQLALDTALSALNFVVKVRPSNSFSNGFFYLILLDILYYSPLRAENTPSIRLNSVDFGFFKT